MVGLNTYRIKGLIYYANITSEESRFRIDLTIAHELAHQNFGNLVTTKLWNQIWLNEGFATYISYFGLKSISPEYDPDKQWLTSYRRRALQTDGKIDTHPLVNISSPMFYFDGISYSKGASLLKMIEKFLTPKVFHEALRTYLAKHSYGTATQWDLFDVLERHAHISGVHPSVAPLTEILESWTLQPGYPLIRVKYVSSRAVLLSQERFIDSYNETSPAPSYWYIPITTMYNNHLASVFDRNVPSIWLSPLEPSKLINLENDFSWIIVNSDASVYSRVLYDDVLTKLIENQLNTDHEIISPLTRAQIIEDSFELAWAGYGQIESALNFTRYLGNELEPVVWSSALNGLGRIYSMFASDENVIVHFKEYVYERIVSSLSTIGLEQDSAEKGISVLHRGSLLHWAGILEIPEALQHAIEKVQYWADSSINSIPSDLHSQTYCNAIIGGDRNIYDTLLNLLPQETKVDVKQAIVRSLGCSKSESILDELRLNLTNENFVIPPDFSFELMIKLSRNTLTRKNILAYFDEHFNAIQNRFDGVVVIAKSLETAAQYWNTQQQLEEVEAFITKYKDDLEDVEKILKRTIKKIENNIAWMEQFSDRVKQWLLNR